MKKPYALKRSAFPAAVKALKMVWAKLMNVVASPNTMLA